MSRKIKFELFMKKLLSFLVVFAFAMSSGLFAQSLSVKGGLNLAKMDAKLNDQSVFENVKMNPGFHIGVTAEFPLNNLFSVEAGAILNTKGFKLSEEMTFLGVTSKVKATQNLFYVDIPVTAKASFELGDNKLFAFAGPYVGVGLFGKTKSEVTLNNNTTKDSEDVEFGDKGDYKRLDYGVLAGAGIELNSLTLGLSYGLGLANVLPGNSIEGKHQVLSISVGYKL